MTTTQFYSTKPELRFCAGSTTACGMLEIGDGDILWQWLRLEIMLNAFCWPTIPHKQFIISHFKNLQRGIHKIVTLQNLYISNYKNVFEAWFLLFLQNTSNFWIRFKMRALLTWSVVYMRFHFGQNEIVSIRYLVILLQLFPWNTRK